MQFDVQSAQIKLLEQKFKRVTTERYVSEFAYAARCCASAFLRCTLCSSFLPRNPVSGTHNIHQHQHVDQQKHVTTITRDEAVCALTRAMMVPELKGEEYEALLSVLPEEQG
jgi:hypothetical protein